MARERRDFSGNAVKAKLSTNITSSATSFTIDTAAGWPSGTNGKFLVCIARNTASEEKMWVQTRSGTTLTLASSGDRGAEGGSAQSHSAGDDVEHTFGETDADEANEVVAGTLGLITTKGDSLVGSAANTLARMPAGANNTVLVSDNAQTLGRKWAQVDGNMLAATVAGAGLTGGNGQPLAAQVDNSSIEINSDTLRVKAGGVTNAMLAGSITQSNLVGTPAWTAYTPTWTASGGGAVLGSGTDVLGAYSIVGKDYKFRIEHRPTAGNGGTGQWRYTLGGGVTSIGMRQTVSATCESAGSARFPASAIIAAGSTLVNVIAVDGSLGVGAGVPFSWAVGSILTITGTIEIA